MIDLFRFLAATCSVLITVYLAYNIAWFLLLIPLGVLFSPFRNRELPIAVATFIGTLFQFYLLTAFMAIIRESWVQDMPHLNIGTAVVVPLVFIPWFFSVYARKAQNLEVVDAAYREVSHRYADEEVWKLGEQWATLRVMVPYMLWAAILGSIMILVSLFVPHLFINPLTTAILSWYDYVLEVPLLPLLLMIGGFLMAVGMIWKALLFFIATVGAVRHGADNDFDETEEPTSETAKTE